ncbi:PucR family transcriptional regulator [Leucobacter viscericola]|nr:PucR family transcriptional regulator [Leucobacter viscericola]
MTLVLGESQTMTKEAEDPVPENATDTAGLTVAAVLDLPELRAGQPELIAGSGHTDRAVRWAHVVAGTGAAAFLDGGELLLTTGAGWPSDPEELAAVTDTLTGTGPAAVILELGTRLEHAPDALIASCEANDIPLVVLHSEVRFVQITQRVHQRILAAQTEALQARAEVHAMLTELGLNRSPVDYVIERLAATLDAPVVLEDSAQRVVAWASGGSQQPDPEHTLERWASAQQLARALPTNWVRVPVEARGTRWGHLIALPGSPHPAGRQTVLELGAFALALGRLADTGEDQWLQLSSKQLFGQLLGGRYRRDTDLAVQLAAGGLPIAGRRLLGATLRGFGDFGAHESLERAILETALRRAVAPEGSAILTPDPDSPREGTLLALLSFPLNDPRSGMSASANSASAATLDGHETRIPALAERLSHELGMLLPDTTPAAWRAQLTLGISGKRVGELITSLERVRAAGSLPTATTVGRVSVQQAEQQPLAYLVRGLSAAPAVQEFASSTLATLVAHDQSAGPGHSGDLLRVLEAYLAHPTNRSLAAQRARLSRSVFYQRIALIEDLLGVDLASGETIATLTVALLARGSEQE